jgi:hypothetical protein
VIIEFLGNLLKFTTTPEEDVDSKDSSSAFIDLSVSNLGRLLKTD